MIALPGSRLPRWLLTRQHDGQAIEIGDYGSIHGFIDREQACLVRQKLAYGDSLLTVLREFRPIRTHTFFIVQPSA